MGPSTSPPALPLSSPPPHVSPAVDGSLVVPTNIAEETPPDVLAAPGSGTFAALAGKSGTGGTAEVDGAGNSGLQAQVDVLSQTTKTLETGMAEILELLRSSREDAAIGDIESIRLPDQSSSPSIDHATSRGNFADLRELSSTALKVPVFVGLADSALRGAWKDIDLWHDTVTARQYRNSLPTFEAVRQLLNANVPKQGHAPKFDVFR